MAEDTGEMTVAQRLGQLLDRGLLPAGGPAEAAERLIERLERPARIALLGLPGAGKSAVLNLLAGTVVVPEMLRLPTIIVQHGPEARMLCTLADGRVETVPGSDLSQIMALNPAMVTLEMDLAALKVISLLEVSAGPMEAEQRRAAIWASKRADIVIWCTTSYLPKEQVVWEGMPDTVKDNGFLFLTKVDLLGSREAAAGMLERVELRAGEEFRQVLSISAKQARSAVLAPGGLDREMFRDSGAAAVISTIKTRVQMARRADVDMAELLLARHVEASSIAARRFSEPGTVESAAPAEPRPWAPPPEDVAPAAARPAAPAPTEAAAGASRVDAEFDTAAILRALSDADTAAAPERVGEPVAERRLVEPAEPDPADNAPAEATAPAPPEPEAVEPEPAPKPRTSPPVPRATVPAQVVGPPVAGKDEPAPAAEPVALGAKRFSDRIKQIPVSDEPPAAPAVPLRTTWKSRNDVAKQPPAPAEKPVSTPPADQADRGLDDAAIAAMVATAATPPAQVRTPRERPPRDAGLASSARSPAEGARAEPPERSSQLFGSRKPAAAPTPDPVALRSADPAPPVAVADAPRQTRSDTPARQLRPSEPPVRMRAAPTSRPAERALDSPAAVMPSPRVAVLRDRKPEPAPPERSERRERPRIAARVTGAPATAVPAALQDGPIPESEQMLVERAITLIRDRSSALAEMIDPDEKLPIDMILEHGRATTEAAIDLLSAGASAALRRINADLGEVLDLIMLMQLEKGHAPADDTLTLLLQIRRDLETLRAA